MKKVSIKLLLSLSLGFLVLSSCNAKNDKKTNIESSLETNETSKGSVIESSNVSTSESKTIESSSNSWDIHSSESKSSIESKTLESSSSKESSSSSSSSSYSSIEEISSTTSSTEAISSSESISSESSSSSAETMADDPISDGISLNNVIGGIENIYLDFNVANDDISANYSIYYTQNDNDYIKVDKELIRKYDNKIRCDILGLKEGKYKIKVLRNNTEDYAISNIITVNEDNRSGYGHYKYTDGIGAYNDDGTLKKDAKVIYVNEENKNTITLTSNNKTYTGLVDIAKNYKDSPLDIRIIGEIKTTQWNYIDTEKVYGVGKTNTRLTKMNELLRDESKLDYWNTTISSNYDRLYEDAIKELGYNSMSNDEANGIVELNGLTNYFSWDKRENKSSYTEFDSYFNELDILYGNNITIEGIGSDAKIFQWGFTFSKCNSIEVKNLEFIDYTEDAIGIQGDSSDVTKYGNYWVHNCTFNIGKNNWDLSLENDKEEGDGSTDYKNAKGYTISYCRYNKTHKTCLVGSSDESLQTNLTLHHNFYNGCSSRLPLLRQTNTHIYNNYYYNCSTTQDIRANAFVYSEFNYFDNSTPSKVSSNAVIKSFNDYFTKSGTTATIVELRNQKLSGSCLPDGKTNYTNFDTNAKLFYFDNVNKTSDIEILNTTAILKTYIPNIAGSGKNLEFDNQNIVDTSSYKDEEIEEEEMTYATYTTTIPDTKGIYGKTTTKVDNVETVVEDYTDTSYVEINSKTNEIKINDTSITETTYAYYMFDTTYDTGTHTYTVKLKTGSNTGSKWSFLQFLDGNSNISIRSCGTNETYKNYLGYMVDGTEVATNLKIAANTEYTIILTINYDNNTASVSINGNSLNISGWTFNEIKGIQFMTAYSAADRSFIVNSISVN